MALLYSARDIDGAAAAILSHWPGTSKLDCSFPAGGATARRAAAVCCSSISLRLRMAAMACCRSLWDAAVAIFCVAFSVSMPTLFYRGL